MKCKVVQETLLEDSASRFDEAVAAHLAGCEECRRFAEDLLELEELTRCLADQCRVPTEFQSETIERLSSLRPGWFPSRGVLLASLLLLAGSVGLLAFSGHSSIETPSTENGAAVAPVDSGSDAQVLDLNAGGGSYIEIVLEQPDGEELILRLPSVIEIRQTELHDDSYLFETSH